MYQMTLSKLKRIAIETLVPGMLLGTDVISSNGLTLIPKDTIVNDKHIFRLKLYQIMSVIIVENDQSETSIVIPAPPNDSLIEKVSHSFVDFKKVYLEKEEIVSQKLHAISNGDPIHLEDLLQISNSLLSSLATKSELFTYLYSLRATDDYTYSHSINVSLLCNVFGHWLKLSNEEINNLAIAGLLHDIGKIQVDQGILNKPGKLTAEEFLHIKRHSRLGYELIQNQDISEDIKYGILMHHEKMDGSGYPLHLLEKDIHYFAKIISIVDIYDAMTSNRSYHKKYSPFHVIQIFEQESFGVLDLTFLFVFLENIAHNYLGKQVVLSSGQEAKIVFIHNTSPSRPLVQIGEEMIDLVDYPSLTIEEIL